MGLQAVQHGLLPPLGGHDGDDAIGLGVDHGLADAEGGHVVLGQAEGFQNDGDQHVVLFHFADYGIALHSLSAVFGDGLGVQLGELLRGL